MNTGAVLRASFLVVAATILFICINNEDRVADQNLVNINISGEITSKTLEEFKAALDQVEIHKKSILLQAIQLNSNGGNNSAAIEIGKIIRERKLNTYVGEDSRCESACVFVLIGGVQRYAFGKIGVHRTTYSRDIPDDSVVQNDINESNQMIANYIKSMGVSSLLDDAIKNTESWRMRY